MRYEVGDLVRVKSLEEIKALGTADKNIPVIRFDIECFAIPYMSKYCDNMYIVIGAENGRYWLHGCESWAFTDAMLELAVEDHDRTI